MRLDTVVAYTYRADLYCPACTIEALITDRIASPGARGMDAEDALNQIAAANGIDRYAEETFDSGDFPKVVFPHMLEDEDRCGACHNLLLNP